MISNRQTHETEVLQARLGARVAARLNAHQSEMPHDITERLRFAREQALSRARFAGAPVAVAVGAAAGTVAAPRRSWTTAWAGASAGAVSHGDLGTVDGTRGWRRLVAVLPLLMLVAGLLLIDHLTSQEQLYAVADIDAQLLADQVPPQAYGDPGFAEFLRSPPP